MIRIVATLIAMMAGVALAAPAFAHASLLASDPADGAVLAVAPRTVALTFDEPVTPVLLRVIDASAVAHPLTDVHLQGDSLVGLVPDGVGNGTLTLSWRVISADSHPVGGSFVFSIGAPTGTAPPAPPVEDAAVEVAIWLSGMMFLGACLFGVGGAFFLAWLAPGARLSVVARPIMVMIGAGLAIGPVTVGLQGVDTLGQGLPALLAGDAWHTGLFTTYGATWLVGELALVAALVATRLSSGRLAAALTALALLGVGASLALSGHASDAPPRELTWIIVLLHGIAAAFWVGSLMPLALLLRRRDPSARAILRRFSVAIPFAVVPLVAAGLLLAVVQLTKVSDLWLTAYGGVLTAKLAAVAGMFALAAYNRYGTGGTSATGALSRSIRVEFVLSVIVVAFVAGFRLTPPPRALFAQAAPTAPLFAMAASADATNMANVNLLPGRVGPNDVLIQVTDRQMNPMTIEGVTVSLADPSAGIEPITRTATRTSDTIWRVDGITVPVAGQWTLTISALLSEFKQVDLETPILIGQ